MCLWESFYLLTGQVWETAVELVVVDIVSILGRSGCCRSFPDPDAHHRYTSATSSQKRRNDVSINYVCHENIICFNNNLKLT